jgi:mannose-6-phosphate isomerase-like protein (cupin superfamily)
VTAVKIYDEALTDQKGYNTRWMVGPWNSDCKIDFGIAFFQPGQKVKKHIHEKVTELFYVVEGELSIQINDQSQITTLKAGQLAYVPPKEAHTLHNMTTSVTKFVVIKTPSIPHDKRFVE